MIDWKNIALSKSDTLKNAMSLLDEWALRIVLVVDSENKLEGVITDGDIRRGLLNGLSLESRVDTVMNHTPLVAFPEVDSNYIRALMMNKNILAIPIVDVSNAVIGLETLESVSELNHANADVVLMAGGFGKRLHPLTEDCPKPLLAMGNKPILECIIQDFVQQGFSRFFISTHYKANLIKEHFEDGSKFGCEIFYVDEDEPLGTAGSLAYLPEGISEDFIVMNADIVSKVNFQNLLSFHREQNRMTTMCIRELRQQSPYGVVTLEYPHVSALQEKPEYSHYINAGIYVLKKSVLNMIKPHEYLDMTSLLRKLIDKGKNVVAFPIHEYWLDIGRIDDYEKVVDGV